MLYVGLQFRVIFIINLSFFGSIDKYGEMSLTQSKVSKLFISFDLQ